MPSITLPNGSGVYRITCTTTGKFYIGSSFEVRQRICAHVRLLEQGQHHNPYLQSAWNKYGSDAFIFTVEEWCERDQLIEREQFYLDTLEPFAPDHFNISRDAQNPSRNMTPEGRRRHSEAQRRRPPPSEETKQKQRAFLCSPENRAHARAVHLGSKASEETRRKMSEAQKRRAPYGPETLKRKSEAVKRHYARKRKEEAEQLGIEQLELF